MLNKNFTLLLSGQLISQVGDKFHMIALSMWVLKTTGSTSKMGLVLAASLLPSLIVGLFSGVFIDRFNRKYIIVGADLIRGAVIAMFALLFLMDMITFPMVLLMQVILSVNAAFFDPAIPSVIPSIVPENKLASANSKHQFVNGFSTVAGAFLGGVCVALFGYAAVFAANAASFIISGFVECFITIPPQHPAGSSKISVKDMIADMKSGYHYIFNRTALLVLIFMVMVIHFFVGSIEVFMPVIADAVSLEGAAVLGVFQGAFGAGCIVIASVLSVFDMSGKEKYCLFTSVFLIGILYMGSGSVGMSGSFAVHLFSVMIFFFGACIITAGVGFKTLLQKKTDPSFAGRVFAVAGSVGNASIPAAMIIYGLLLEKMEVRPLLMGSGLILMLTSVAAIMLYKEKEDGYTTGKIQKTAAKN